MPLPPEIHLRTGRMKLPQGSLFWHEGGKPHPQAATVVLLHGSWYDSTQWLSALPTWAQTHHCLAPDLLGFGESSRPGAYSVALQVEVLASWLAALRVGPCHLVGHSLGAWVAAQYALSYPDQVKTLTAIAPEGVSDRSSRGRWRRDRWLVAPWSPLPLVLPWLGKSPWAQGLRQRRRRLRQSPAACQLLFRRRRSAIQAELLQQRLGDWQGPTLVVEPTAADPLTQRQGQTWLRLLTAPYHELVAPADGPLGLDEQALIAVWHRLPMPQSTLPSQRWPAGRPAPGGSGPGTANPAPLAPPSAVETVPPRG